VTIIEQLEFYLEVTAEMEEQERSVISTQISNAQASYALLKKLLFPSTSNITGLEIIQINNSKLLDNGTVTTVDQQPNTADETLQNSDHCDVGVDVQAIIDEGVDDVEKLLSSISPVQGIRPSDENMNNIQEMVDEAVEDVVQELHAISKSQEQEMTPGAGTGPG
jgi:hypothetical protein